MFTILGLGFLLGLQHAMEADHVATVVAMTAGRTRLSRVVRHGLFWGLGHALALSAFAGVIVLARGNVPPALNVLLECIVAVMLIGLGVMVIWRVLKERLHFHSHSHVDGRLHFHAHSHAGEARAHDKNRHDHDHEGASMRRSLLVGVMHGLAGSAALIALAAPGEWVQGLGFIFLFGVGSIAGMVLLSSVIALPLMLSGKVMTGLNRSLQLGIGAASIAIGGYYAANQIPALMALI
ncbi:MAG: urease accessory protein [Rhodospirillaceae bacterium]|jgi:ABC-type nickel/cobalt efflux system permease component RcnA|nr:urease accessory protein [Rhodospirillaceae bacterium]MBT4042940.1 urease accessory protein [Rhodospirillaceae bacterium]MBT4686759.1 urease accessory protein [Rhodospirillaceae bacterium]MBT5082454.1 urease accessory protein [Rhodospirillaceae bacterium]MBT5524009.1 urease accessory protein [Rhodospirillaceae bacterium]